VWFDGLVMNLDRTPRNPNLLTWHGRTWLIDHGAALYPQHSEAGLAASARDPFKLIAQHVLLPAAGRIADADARLAAVAADAVDATVDAVPAEWLTAGAGAGTAGADLAADADAARDSIRAFFAERLGDPRPFVEEAERGRP
jgi:hypothetical protein